MKCPDIPPPPPFQCPGAFCTITPDRGDRPDFMMFCRHQLNRMNTPPQHSYFIDYNPKSTAKDLVERVQKGIEMAKADGFDICFIVESDDYYPADYFDKIDDMPDFQGSQSTTYYHLANNGYQAEVHHGRASLFTTGFRISALKGFDFNKTRKVFLDVSLWDHARRKRKDRKFQNTGAIGIKHGIGLTGGIGHRQQIYRRFDRDWSWLAARVDSEALEFYKDMQKKINGN